MIASSFNGKKSTLILFGKTADRITTAAGSTWIYYLAPFSAAIVCAAVYHFLRWAEFATPPPSQDHDGMHLLLRDAQGNAMGYVDQTDADAPELEHMHASAQQRRISLERAATTAAPNQHAETKR